jgi:hypothetical protein
MYRAAAIRNLKISSVAITSTLIFMLGASLTTSFASSNGDVEAAIKYAHMQMWQFYGGGIDLFGEFMAIEDHTYATAIQYVHEYSKLSNVLNVHMLACSLACIVVAGVVALAFPAD